MKVLTCYCISYLTVNYMCIFLHGINHPHSSGNIFESCAISGFLGQNCADAHFSLPKAVITFSASPGGKLFSHIQKFGVLKIAQVSWFRMPWYDIRSGKNKTDWCAHLINLMGNFTSTLTRMLQKNKWWPTTNQFLLKYFFWPILHLSSWSFLLF